MTRMPDFEAEIRREWDKIRDHLAPHPDPPSLAAQIASAREPQAPAAQPVNLTAQPGRTDMSLTADVENGYAAIRNEMARFEQALPGLLETAKKVEGSPIGDLAIKAAGLVAQGLIPGESLASIARIADAALGELVTTFNPPGAQQAPAQPAAPVPAGQ